MNLLIGENLVKQSCHARESCRVAGVCGRIEGFWRGTAAAGLFGILIQANYAPLPITPQRLLVAQIFVE